MRASDGLVGPVGYSGWWLVLGIGLLAAIVLWYGWVFWSTRKSAGERRARPRVDARDARERSLAEIDEVAARADRHEISVREAHQRLSAIVRGYAGAVAPAPVPAVTMTRAELDEHGLTDIAALVGDYYPKEFDRVETGDIGSALAAARALVSAWG